MTFVTVSNLILMALCVVVIVQSLRMAKGISEIRSSSLKDGVAQLDGATARAQAVLTELKTVLGTSLAAQNRAIANGEALRDELSVVVGIGNAVAERIVDAAAAQNGVKAKKPAMPDEPETQDELEAKGEPDPKDEADPKGEPATNEAAPARRTGQRKSRSRTGHGRRKASTDTAISSQLTADTFVAGRA